MATFGELKARIADDLARSDLGPQIGNEVLDAVAHHSAERFWFNERSDHAFTTVAGQALYTIPAANGVSDFVKIDRMASTLGGMSTFMRRADPVELAYMSDAAGRGHPSCWAYYGDQLRLYPTPDKAYSIRIQGHARLTPLAADTEANAWTTHAESMIRAAARKRLYARVIRNQDEAALAEADETREHDRLRRETVRRQAGGMIRPYW